MNFDEVLNLLDPTEQEVITQAVAKHPEIRNGWMRKDDYSRKLDDLRAKETSFSQVAEYAHAWDSWKTENWDETSGTTKAEAALRNRIQELEARGEEMTFDDINKHITGLGLAKDSDIKSLLSEKEKIFGDSLQGSAYVGAKLAELSSRHVLEFKEPFKATEFLSKVNGYGTSDLDMAYDIHVKDVRKSRDEEKLNQRLKDIEKEAFEKGRKEAIEGVIASNGGQVTPTNESSNDLGYFQRKQLGLQEDAIPEGRSVAQYAAQKFREDNLRTANV